MEAACSSGSRSRWSILLTFQKNFCLAVPFPAVRHIHQAISSGLSSPPALGPVCLMERMLRPGLWNSRVRSPQSAAELSDPSLLPRLGPFRCWNRLAAGEL